MVDVDTFLTALYVMVDDFCQSQPRRAATPRTRCVPRPIARSSPSPSSPASPGSPASGISTATRSIRLRDAFPTLPDRSQFNRCVRLLVELIEEVALHLAEAMETREMPLRGPR